MRQLLTAVFLLALAVACDPFDIGFGAIRHSGEPPGRSPDRDPEDLFDYGPEAGDTSVYACGVEFPKTYDWAKDSAQGNVTSSLVLFRDGERVCVVPSGPGERASSDPDRHRIAAGKLWTDFVDGSETIICANGKESFRYSGQERIYSFQVFHGDVYTLGTKIGGQGISFRKNGDVVFEDKEGYFVAPLHRDAGHWYFAYRTTLGASEAISKSQYFIVEDGVPLSVTLPMNTSAVHDICMSQGELVCIVSLSGSVSNPFLVYNGISRPIGSNSYTPLDCKVGRTKKGELQIIGHERDRSGTVYAFAWKEKEKIKNKGMYSTYVAIEDVYMLICNDPATGLLMTSPMTGPKVVPPPCTIFASTCVYHSGTRIAVGYTSHSDGAGVWVDGQVVPLEINGFLTGVSLWP